MSIYKLKDELLNNFLHFLANEVIASYQVCLSSSTKNFSKFFNFIIAIYLERLRKYIPGMDIEI